MRRPERQRTLRDKLGWLRGAIPDLAIRTTCLVGFPGETDDDFRELLTFLEEAQFDRLGAFSYSPQEGTRGMQYADDVPDAVKRERLEELLEVQRAISAERLARFVGREVPVLVDRLADPDEERGPEAFVRERSQQQDFCEQDRRCEDDERQLQQGVAGHQQAHLPLRRTGPQNEPGGDDEPP